MFSIKAKALAIAALAIATALGASACGAQQNAPAAGSAPAETSAAEQAAPAADSSADSSAVDTDAEYNRAYAGQGLTNAFIGEPFYDGTIKSEDDALAAIDSVADRIGADETTTLDPVAVRPTEDGTTYYVFRQLSGDVYVHGACVKVVVDADGHATGLISSILPNVRLEPVDQWGVTKEQAEQAVLDYCAQDGAEGIKIIDGASELTVVPIDTNSEIYHYAWVVYTKNYMEGSDMPYLAHYVGENGTYLYSMQISEPQNADALAGDSAAFEFDKMEPSTWEGDVNLAKGGTRHISVPVMVDPETGDTILGDPERKIVCADYAEFINEDIVDPRVGDEDGSFFANELLIYDTFIRVWDYYKDMGWTGADGEGTPSILLMEIVNDNGDLVDNACYMGRKWGFQTFGFSSLNAAGEATDVIGHEFSHCVTGTTMTTNIYLNDYGAINEGMSDVLGNLIEIGLADSTGVPWVHGENLSDENRRYFDDPHKGAQPAFVWDAYYVPAVETGTETNDQGGVHRNSSLLNVVSYSLNQAGMEPADQMYFWMNVALAMTPGTDYAQLAELLPWCMEQSHYPDYVDAVRDAVAKAGYSSDREAPTTAPEGCGIVKLAYPDAQAAAAGNIAVYLFTEDGSSDAMTYPAAGTADMLLFVPEGDYRVKAIISVDGTDTWMMATEDGWVTDQEGAPAFHVTAGETLELPTQGL